MTKRNTMFFFLYTSNISPQADEKTLSQSSNDTDKLKNKNIQSIKKPNDKDKKRSLNIGGNISEIKKDFTVVKNSS